MRYEDKRWCGMAFAMSNRVQNSISAFRVGLCGELRFEEELATGGSGSGEPIVDPLTSQGSLAVGGGGRFLFAVNAGDNTVSSFRLGHESPSLVSAVPSGGIRPVSIAVQKNLVYVVNAGGGELAANLSGFFVDHMTGVLTPIPGSATPLGPASSLPACAVFSPDGGFLVVSLRGSNLLVAYTVQHSGLL